MKFLSTKRRRRRALVLFIIIALLAIYLNRAYAHIYNEIGHVALCSSDHLETYMIKVQTTNQDTRHPIVYTALGDSLTAGVGVKQYQESYPYLLAQDLAQAGQPIILKDRAIPGERTAGLIAKLLPLAIKDQPQLITVLIGVNDIHGNISAKVFQQNYNIILKQLTNKTKAQIYVINLPYIGSDRLVLPPYNYLLAARTQEFNRIIKRLAQQYSVHYIDLYTPTVSLFKSSGKFYAADSFHPSALGYRLWAKIIYDYLHY